VGDTAEVEPRELEPPELELPEPFFLLEPLFLLEPFFLLEPLLLVELALEPFDLPELLPFVPLFLLGHWPL
jgi:hypothetical protein